MKFALVVLFNGPLSYLPYFAVCHGLWVTALIVTGMPQIVKKLIHSLTEWDEPDSEFANMVVTVTLSHGAVWQVRASR